MENVTTFKDLYTRDYNLTDIYAERQKWVDGALFKREYPRQCNGIIFLNGCSGKYTDKSGESFLRSMRAKVPLNIERKMDMAKKMLENSTTPVQEISEILGFESVSYFCKLFKKKTGMTPGEYRKGK